MLHEIQRFPEPAEPKEENKKLSEEPSIHPSCHLNDCKIGAWTALGEHTRMSETTFGDYSYTAGHVSIIYSTIGKFCSIANSVRINPGNHPQWRVTQHHCTYRRVQYGFDEVEDTDFFQWRREHHCEIGHDVWIGHGATIMAGVRVGAGAIIGAGAVVTKDVQPYEIVGGVPSKLIKKRFPDEISQQLLKIAWWDWERDVLVERFHDLMDIDSFLKKYGSKL